MTTPNGQEPAYPVQASPWTTIPSQEGMSLRQYAAIHLQVPDSGDEWLDKMIRKARRDRFAIAAVEGGLIAHLSQPENPGTWRDFVDVIGECAYDIADAMPAEREGEE